jgi:tRNA A-37 threonylcarbamoyl transferase component Bud32
VPGRDDRPLPDSEDLPELRVPETTSLSPGDRGALASALGDRYEIVSRLGAGAFGAVYRAHDRVLARDVAIKTIRLEAFVEPAQLQEVKKRFQREAQVAARLRHPNIVTTHDIVETASTSFIVMELVDGHTLQAVLAGRGRLGLEEVIGVLGQAGSALDHAHVSQIVHRDVKPGNIMVEPDGHVKVMDFGIAKVETGQNLTSTGNILGTPNYMSPEQARGGKLDARSDLFSLGCVLYECLTGVKPFQGETITAILLKIVTEEPPPVDFAATGLPRELEAVLRRAMAKDPAARFSSATEMVAAVRAAAPTLVGAATPVTPRATPPPLPGEGLAPAATTAPRPRGRLRLAAAVLLAVLGGGVWLVRSGGPGARAAVPAADAGARAPAPLVAREEVGFVGRLLGRKPRLLVTLPVETSLHASLEAPVSSASTRTGDALLAELTRPVRIEGVEAIPTGSRLAGKVSHAASAEEAGGRGEMTLEFDSVELPGGDTIQIHTSPLVLRAPPQKHKDTGVIAGLAGLGAVVGGLVGGRKGAVAGTVAGGAAGVGVARSEKGQNVSLGERAQVLVTLVEPVTVACPSDKPD